MESHQPFHQEEWYIDLFKLEKLSCKFNNQYLLREIMLHKKDMITNLNKLQSLSHILKEITHGTMMNLINQMKLFGLNKQKKKLEDHTIILHMENKFIKGMEHQSIHSIIKDFLLLRIETEIHGTPIINNTH